MFFDKQVYAIAGNVFFHHCQLHSKVSDQLQLGKKHIEQQKKYSDHCHFSNPQSLHKILEC